MDSPLLDQTPEDDLWEDVGIYKRNKITGEMVLKTISGAEPGVNLNDKFGYDYSKPMADNNLPAVEMPDWQKVIKQPFAQGGSWLGSAGIQVARTFNNITGDDEDVKLYDEMENEFDKTVGSYTWGKNQTGGSAGQELFGDAKAGRWGEFAGDALQVAASTAVDLISTMGLAEVGLAPLRATGATVAMANLASKVPYVKSLLKAAEGIPFVKNLTPEAKEIASAASIGFGAREAIQQEDQYTTAGLPQYAAVPLALAAGATSSYLEWLGSAYMTRLARPELAQSLFNEVKPKLWQEILSEASTEGAQGFISDAFRDVPVSISQGKWPGTDKVKQWLYDGATGAALAPLGVLGLAGYQGGISKIEGGLRGVVRSGSDAATLATATNPQFEQASTTLAELKDNDRKTFNKAYGSVQSLMQTLGGETQEGTALHEKNLTDAYNIAKKYSHIAEVQDIYSMILDRYNYDHGANEDARIESSANAETNTTNTPDGEAETTPDLKELLADHNFALSQSIGTTDRDSEDFSRKANRVIDTIGRTTELNGSFDEEGLGQVVAAAELLHSEAVYPYMTRSQKALFEKRAKEAVELSTADAKTKKDSSKRIADAIETAENKADSRLLVRGVSDQVKSGFDGLLESFRKAYGANDASSAGIVEAAIAEHRRLSASTGVGYKTTKGMSAILEKALAGMHDHLATKSQAPGGISTDEMWKFRAYSYIASHLDKKSTTPSIPENTVAPEPIQDVVNGIAESVDARKQAFRKSMDSARAVDAVAGSILGDHGTTPFSQVTPTVQQQALATLNDPSLRQTLTDFVGGHFGSAIASGFNNRIDAALTLLSNGTTMAPGLEQPYTQLTNIFKQYGLDAEDAYNFMFGKMNLNSAIEKMFGPVDLANNQVAQVVSGAMQQLSIAGDMVMPIWYRVNEASVIAEEDAMASTAANEYLKGIKRTLDASGQSVPGVSNLTFSPYPKLAQELHDVFRATQIRFWQTEAMDARDKDPDYKERMGKKLQLNRTAIVHNLTNLMFKSATRLALDIKKEYEARNGKIKGRDIDKIIDFGLEFKDSQAILHSLVAEEILKGEEDLQDLVHRIKVKMVLAGGVKSRKYNDGHVNGSRAEASLIFNKFAKQDATHILPYLTASLRDLSAEKIAGGELNKHNAETVLNSLEYFLDNWAEKNSTKDMNGVIKDTYMGSMREDFPGEKPSEILQNLYVEACKDALVLKNKARSASGKGRTTSITRNEVMAGAKRYIEKKIRTKEELGQIGDVSSIEEVLRLIEQGHIGFLSGEEDAVVQEVSSKSKMELLRDLDKDLEEQYKALVQQNESRPDGESQEQQDALLAQLVSLTNAGTAKREKIMAETTDNGNNNKTVSIAELKRARELYTRAMTKFQSERSRYSITTAPEMTHSFSPDRYAIDDSWTNSVLALIKHHRQYAAGARLTEAQRFNAAEAAAYFSLNALQAMPHDIDASDADSEALSLMRDLRSRMFVQRLVNFSSRVNDQRLAKKDMVPGQNESELKMQNQDIRIMERVKESAKRIVMALSNTRGEYEPSGKKNENPGYNPSKPARIEKDFKDWVKANGSEIRRSNVSHSAEQYRQRDAIDSGTIVHSVEPQTEYDSFYKEVLGNIEFASNPNNVGTLYSSASKIKELFAIAKEWNEAKMDQVRFISDFVAMTKTAGMTRWFDINGKDLPTLARSMRTRDYFNELTPDEKQAFYYVKKYADSASGALNKSATVGALVNTMVKAGYTADEQTMNLALVNALAESYSEKTGKSFSDLLFKSGASIGVSRDKDNVAGTFIHDILPKIRLNKDANKDLTEGIRPIALFHEFVHGVITSGAFSELLGKSGTETVEKALGVKIPRPGDKRVMDPSQEKIQSLISSVIIGNSIPNLDQNINKSIQQVRRSLLRNLANERIYNDVSGYPLMSTDEFANEQESQVIIGALSLNPNDSELLFQLTDDMRVIMPALQIQGVAQDIGGVNIIPLLAGTPETLDTIVQSKSLWKAYKASEYIIESTMLDPQAMANFVTIVNNTNDPKVVVAQASGLGLDALDLDGESLSVIKKWVQKTGYAVQPIRIPPVIHSPNTTTDKLEAAVKKPTKKQNAESAEPNILLSTVGIPHSIGSIMEKMHEILAAHADMPLASDQKGKPSTVKALVASIRKLSLADATIRALRSIDPSTSRAEELFKNLGMPREFFMTHMLNGVADFGRKFISGDVMAYRGSKWGGNLVRVNEGLAAILSDMDASGMASDVYAWMGAQRQLEIERGNKMGILTDRTDMMKSIDSTASGAARVALMSLQMRYGKDGGAAGQLARRLVKWQNAVVLEPQLRIGMISKDEYDKAIRSSEWYIPLRKFQDAIKSNPNIAKTFNDGVNSAFKALRGDTIGAEHPLQEMVSKALYMNYISTAQELRQNLTGSLADAVGWDKDKMLQMGIEILRPEEDRYAEEVEVTNTNEYESQMKKYAATKTLSKGYKLKTIEKGPRRGEQSLFRLETGNPISEEKARLWIDDHARDLGMDKNSGMNKNVYTSWHNGVPTYFVIHDGELLDAMDGIHPTHISGPQNKFLKVLYGFARGMTNLKTSLIVKNPIFVAKMLTLDMPTAIARSTFGMKNPGDLLSSLFQSTASIFPSLAREFPKTFKDFLDREAGVADQSSYANNSISRTDDRPVNAISAEKLHKQIASMNYTPSKKTSTIGRTSDAIIKDVKAWRAKYIAEKEAAMANYGALRNAIVKPYSKVVGKNLAVVSKFLGGVANAGDSVLRMTERKAANRLREKGVPIQDIYIDYVDRNLTLDFSRKSNTLAVVNSLYAFAAPGFQDMSMFMKNITHPTKALPYLLRSLLVFSAPAIINYIAWHDDDEWKKLDGWAKYNFFYLKKNKAADGTFQGFSRVPWGLGLPALVFKDPIVATLEYASGRDPEAFNDMFHNAVQQSPFGFAAQPSEKLSLGQAAASTLAPTAIDPFVDLTINRDAQMTQNKVDATIGLQGQGSPQYADRDKAGILDVGVAKALSGTKAELTPRQSSYLVTRTFPGMGATIYTFANKTFTNMYRKMNPQTDIGEEYRPPIRLQPWVVSSAYGDKSNVVQRFNSTLLEVTRREEDYKKLLTIDPEAAYELARKYKELGAGVPVIFRDSRKWISEQQKIKNDWINKYLKMGYDEELVYATAVTRFDIPISIRAGTAMDYYYGIKGMK